jgi:short-subunit dehydrogenase
MLKTGIKVTTVTPSYINTGMFEGAKVNFLLPNLKPEKAVRKIISGIENDKIFVRMPALVYLVPFLKGILPSSWFDLFIGKGLGVYASMRQFKGRK